MRALQNFKKLSKNSLFLSASLCWIFTLGCASPEKPHSRGEEFAIVAAAVGAGALIGSQTAPSFEKPEQHALFWGALLGSTTAIFLEIQQQNIAMDLEKERLVLLTELEKKLKPRPLHLASEGYVSKDGMLWGAKIPRGTRYQLLEGTEWRMSSPSTIQKIERRLILTAPQGPLKTP